MDNKLKELVVSLVHSESVEKINGVHAVSLNDQSAWRLGTMASPINGACYRKASWKKMGSDSFEDGTTP